MRFSLNSQRYEIKKWQQNKESSALDGFEDKETILSDVKVDVVFGFIGDIGSEISAYKTVPISIVSTIELIFEMSCHLLNGVHFFKCWFCCVQNVCFYFDADVPRLYHRLVLFVLLHLISFKLLFSNYIFYTINQFYLLCYFDNFW